MDDVIDEIYQWVEGLGLGISLVLLTVLIFSMGCGAPALTEEIAQTQEAWNVLEMCPVEIETVDQLTLNDACLSGKNLPENARLDGCAKINDCKILVSNRINPDRRRRVLIHEMGHILRGDPGHLVCELGNGHDIMCPDGGNDVDEPTDRDRAFIGEP